MVNAFEALIRSPMLFRMPGRLFLTAGIGRPFIREETSVDARGRTSNRTILSDHGYLAFAWSECVQQNRYYGYGHVETMTEISDVTVEDGIYSFTVNYREYETRQGERGSSTNNYSNLPNNALVYVRNFVNNVYGSVMKKHFPNMRSKDSFFDNFNSMSNGSYGLNPETLEEIFGAGISTDDFVRAQEEISSRLREFYERDLHKEIKFKVGDVTVPKWQRHSKPHGFHFVLKRSEEFRLSLQVKFAKDMLVSPQVTRRSWRVDNYTTTNGRLQTSRNCDVTLERVFFKVTLPEEIAPPTNNGGGRAYHDNGWSEKAGASNTEQYRLKVLEVLSSGTKSRPKRGAWQGPYTGISMLKSKVSRRTYVEYVSEYGMPNCEPSLTSFKARLPNHTTWLDVEGREQILTPVVDISPIELGHVNLYRLGNSMYDLQGTRLNEYLVPSLKDFILSISQEKVLTLESEHQIECVGNDVTCKKLEQHILPAGSYLVKVKDFCNKHHDANRPEYNTGMGAFVNLQITTRNVLRVIKVHDGQIREDTVEFVGAEAIATTFNDFDNFDERW